MKSKIITNFRRHSWYFFGAILAVMLCFTIGYGQIEKSQKHATKKKIQKKIFNFFSKNNSFHAPENYLFLKSISAIPENPTNPPALPNFPARIFPNFLPINRGFAFLIYKESNSSNKLFFKANQIERLWRTINGIARNVRDGDSFDVERESGELEEGRILGIDAPELKQRFGENCKKVLSDLIEGKRILFQYKDVDAFGRKLARVYTIGKESININAEMLRQGCSWDYRISDFPKDERKKFRQIFKEVKTSKIGLWAEEKPCKPSVFRKGKCDEQK